MTKNTHFIPGEKPIFWLKRQCFEHFNLCNLNLFRLPQNVVFRGISSFVFRISVARLRTMNNELPTADNWPLTPNFIVHKYLRVVKVLYICRDSSTDAERSLQIHPFLTNKPNFRKSQMNVTFFITREYEQMDTWSSGKNKANSNPIQTQYKPNSNPIQTQFKPNTNPIQTQLLKREK